MGSSDVTASFGLGALTTAQARVLDLLKAPSRSAPGPPYFVTEVMLPPAHWFHYTFTARFASFRVRLLQLAIGPNSYGAESCFSLSMQAAILVCCY